MRVTVYQDGKTNPAVFNTNVRTWRSLERTAGGYRIKDYQVEIVEEILCHGPCDGPHGALTVLNGLNNIYAKSERVVIEKVPITEAKRITIGKPSGDVVVFHLSNDDLVKDLRDDVETYTEQLKHIETEAWVAEAFEQLPSSSTVVVGTGTAEVSDEVPENVF